MYLVGLSWSGQRGAGAGVGEVNCLWGENNPRKHRAFEGVSIRAGRKSGYWFFRLKGSAFTTIVPYNYDTVIQDFPVTFPSRFRTAGGRPCQPVTRHHDDGDMKLVLLLLAASVGCLILASFLLFLGLQALEMNWWQGATLGIAMWTLKLASLALLIAAVWRGVRTFRNRGGAIRSG